MPAFTTHLHLAKPGGGSSGLILPDEVQDIDVLNGNADIIDGWATTVDAAIAEFNADEGAWQNWTPAFHATSFANSGASYSGRYKQIGKTVFGHAVINLGTVSNSGAAGAIYTVTLPTAVASSESGKFIGTLWAALAGHTLQNGTDSINGAPLRADGGVPLTLSGTLWQQGNPMGALGTGAVVLYQFCYESA